jgi:hypothetical protein
VLPVIHITMSREGILNHRLPQALTEKIMGYVRDLEWAEHKPSHLSVMDELIERNKRRENPCDYIGHTFHVLEWYPGAWDSFALMECSHCKLRTVRHA